MRGKLKLGNLVPRSQFVGEFALIVVGVLVALMVDSWIAGRNDEALRQEYVSRLTDDIRADVSNLDYRIEFFGDVETFGLQTLERLQTNDSVGLDAVIAAYYAAETYPFTPSDHTYVDLQNTGNIRLIRDLGLRTSIARYYLLTDTAVDPLDEDYRRVVRGIIPFNYQSAIREHCPTTVGADQIPTGFPRCDITGFDAQDVNAVFDAIRSHPGMSELLTYRVSQAGVAVFLFSAQRHVALELLERLEDAV